MWPKPDTLCQVWAKSWVGTFFPCYVVDLIFQTVNSVRANNLILKYRRFTTLEAEYLKILRRGSNLTRSPNMVGLHLKLYSMFRDLSWRSIGTARFLSVWRRGLIF